MDMKKLHCFRHESLNTLILGEGKFSVKLMSAVKKYLKI